MKRNVSVQEKEERAHGESREPESSVEEVIRESEGNVTSEDQKLENNSEGQITEDEEQENKESEPEDIPKTLMAVYPILYHSHQYKIGDMLPANDPEMVKAWLDAGTAAWEYQGEKRPLTKSGVAIPGLPGRAAGPMAERGDDLVGRIPESSPRKK